MMQLKSGQSHKNCLTNHTQSISHHIMPLVINAIGGGHTHILTCKQKKQFQETRRTLACGWQTTGLKSSICI